MDIWQKTQDICRSNGIKPVRSRGQNFLISEDIYKMIIEASDLKTDEIVLEVGPGLGFLTEKLAERTRNVLAVELDDKLANVLRYRFKKEKIQNVEVLNKNILDFSSKQQLLMSEINDSARINDTGYKIVANLPYNITSIFLRKFLETESLRPEMMVLMLQKEVAERIVARPGQMSLLSLSVQFYSEPEIVGFVDRKDFWPEPEVNSAIIRLWVHKEKNIISPDDEKKFFRLAKFGFSSKRKMLKNNLAGGLKISQEEASDLIVLSGLSPKVRAQELSLKDWVKLFGIFHKFML